MDSLPGRRCEIVVRLSEGEKLMVVVSKSFLTRNEVFTFTFSNSVVIYGEIQTFVNLYKLCNKLSVKDYPKICKWEGHQSNP